MPNDLTLLSINQVHATYNHAISALNGVSLKVRSGEILALLGSNGAGKSTTLKAVSNLIGAERGQITSGEIFYDGRDISKRAPSDLVRDGLVQVLEGRHCFKSLTVAENLITGGLGRGSSRAEIRNDIDRIHHIFPRLNDKRTSLAGLTSGGEQQMLAIGRALMARPRLLVLDEPSMGLAPMVVRDIFNSLDQLNRDEGLTILVAEQNSAIALKHAHRVVVIEHGSVVLEGTAEELRERSDIKAFYLGQGTRPDQANRRPAA